MPRRMTDEPKPQRPSSRARREDIASSRNRFQRVSASPYSEQRASARTAHRTCTNGSPRPDRVTPLDNERLNLLLATQRVLSAETSATVRDRKRRDATERAETRQNAPRRYAPRWMTPIRRHAVMTTRCAPLEKRAAGV